MHFSPTVAFLLQIALAAVLTPAAAQEGAPKLAPGDTLEISVFSRPEYDTDTVITADGAIAINGLGRLKVAGMTVVDVEQAVTAALVDLRVSSPLVIARVSSYRDVGVLGDVSEPGLFSYRPNMTILHALAQAGGFLRLSETTSNDDVNIVDAQSNLSSLLDRLALAEVRRDRISNQMDGAPVLPGDGSTEMNDYQRAEADIATTFATTRARDRDILTQQLEAIREQIDLLKNISSTYSVQMEEAEADVVRLEGLFERGLVGAERMASARDKLSRITIQSLENESAYSTALQNQAQVELALAGLGTSRTQDLVEELRDVTSEINQLRNDISGARDRLRTLQSRAAATGASGTVATAYDVTYEVTRHVDGAVMQIEVQETDPVLPGDVLTVTRTPRFE